MMAFYDAQETLQLGWIYSQEKDSKKEWWMGIFAIAVATKRLEGDQASGRGWYHH